MTLRRPGLLSSCLLLCASAGASDTPAPQAANAPQTFVARVEALALLETLTVQLLSTNSATLTLEHWCDLHRLATTPRIVAERHADVDKPASAQQRLELGVTYVPSRLTPEMNRLLDTTETPFGKVVQPLHFQRHTLSSQLLWRPLAEGWEMNALLRSTAAPAVPPKILENRAVLTLPDGTPFSEVVESYTANVLGFPLP
jgi:hypothetical protein